MVQITNRKTGQKVSSGGAASEKRTYTSQRSEADPIVAQSGSVTITRRAPQPNAVTQLKQTVKASSQKPSAQNTAFERSGKTRDEYDSAVRQSYARRNGAGTAASSPAAAGRSQPVAAPARERQTITRTDDQTGRAGGGFTSGRPYSLGTSLQGAAQKGLGQIAKAGGAGAALAEDVLLAPLELLSGMELGTLSDTAPLNTWNEAIKQEQQKVEEYYRPNMERGGKGAELLETLGAATVAAAPQAVLAMLTGGGSVAAQSTAGLSAAASSALSPSISGTVANAVRGMARNPQFWTSFSQMVGPSYEDALSNGASMPKAALQAVGSGLMNAAVEIGGGLETLPEQLRGGDRAWKLWVSGMLDEGKEEVVQGVIERAMQNVTYGAGNPLLSATDERAILNPYTAAQEFAGGAVVGGILGGGQIGGNRALSAFVSRPTPVVEDGRHAIVDNFASTMDQAGNTTLRQFYSPDQDPEVYARAMVQYYNEGRAHPEEAFNGSAEVAGISRAQAEAAYIAGQADANKLDVSPVDPDAMQSTAAPEATRLETGTDPEYTEVERRAEAPAEDIGEALDFNRGIAPTEMREDVYGGEGVDESRNGSAGREYRLDPQESGSLLAGGAVSASAGRRGSGQAQRAAEIRAAAQAARLVSQSTASLGIGSGTTRNTVTVLPSSVWTEEMRTLSRDQGKKGRQVIYFTGALELNENGQTFTARGAISSNGKRIWIRADSDTLTVEQIAKHEEYHAAAQKDKTLNRRLKDELIRKHGSGWDAFLSEAYADKYFTSDSGDVTADADYILEEILADAYAGIDVLDDMDAAPARATELTGDVQEAVREADARGPPSGDTETRASREQKYWMPKLTQKEWTALNGARDSQLQREDHQLGDIDGWVYTGKNGTNVFAIYSTEDMSDPTLLYACTGERARWFGENIGTFKEELYNGLNRNRKSDGAITSAIRSIIDKHSYHRRGASGRGAAADASGVDGRQSGSNRGSDYRGGEEAGGSDVTRYSREQPSKDSQGRELTEEQAEFFKDSQVRNTHRQLKVMYRGGAGDFTVFDRKMSSYSNLYGRGFYFTDSESHAKQYGSSMAFYLNITNPVPTNKRTITMPQMLSFLEMVAANEDDYSFENYGYGATPASVLRSVFSGKSDFAMLYDVSQTAIGDMVEAVELFNQVNGTEFDGLILDTETVAFYPEQIKQTDNQNPTRSPDIRYSRELETVSAVTESQQFKRWFGNSKAVNADGSPAVLYHQTDGEFTVFDPRHTGAGRNDDGTPFGIFMKTTPDDIGLRGKRQMSLYASIQNPLRAENREALGRALEKLSPEYAALREEHRALDDEYHARFEEAKKALRGFITEWRENNPDASRKALYDVPQFNTLYEAEDLVLDEWTEKADELSKRAKEVLTQALRDAGYDGVILARDAGSFGRSTDAYIALDPAQVKSATDNIGTFNKADPDIRYSRELENLSALREQNEALREKLDYWKGQTKQTKPEQRTVRKGDIEKLSRHLVKAYDSDLTAADITADLQALGDTLVRGGDLSWTEVKDRAVRIAHEIVNSANVLVNGEVMEDYKGIRKYLREHPVSLADKSDIADWNDFRKRNSGRFPLSDNGTPVDVVWGELAERFGESYFPESITNPADMVQHISDLLDGMEPIFENPFSYHMAEATEYVANDIIDTLLSEEVRQTPPTFADRQAARLDEARAKGKQQTQQARQQGRERLAEAKQQGREAVDRQRLADDMYYGRKAQETKRKNQETLTQAKAQAKERAAERLAETKELDRARLEVLREQKDARIAEIRQQGRERVAAVLAREQARREEQVARLKDHYRTREAKARQSRKARELRRKIQNHAKDLSAKLLRPTDKKHIPEALRQPVAALLESINLESGYDLDLIGGHTRDHHGIPTKRTAAFSALKEAYREIAGELVIDPDLLGDADTAGLLDEVIKMGDTRLADMTAEQLETVWQTVRAVEASIRSANKMFAAARFQTVSDAAEALRQYNQGKKQKTEFNYIGKLQKLSGLDMLTPEAYLHRLGPSGDAVFRMMRDAQDQHVRLMKEVSDFTHEALKDVDVRGLEREMHTVTLGGEEVQLSTAQLMELYALMQRPQAQEHILTGGILPDVVSNKGLKAVVRAKPVRGVTAEEVNNALSLLTAEQVSVAEALQKYASTTLSDFGNRASLEVYNYKKFLEDHYWPIRSSKTETKRTVEKDSQVTSVANRGFTKAVKPHANTSLKLGSIFDTFSTHASEMATYAAWLGTTEDLNRIRNFTFRDDDKNRVDTVGDILNQVHGREGDAYMTKLLSDIVNGVKGTHGETDYMGGLTGKYKAASVGANLRVIIQQPTSILRALDMIDGRYLIEGLKPNDGWKKALQYAPIAQWKDWGYFDINTGRQMKDVLFDSDSKSEKVKQVSMWGAGKMDSLAWGQLWNAVEAETKATNKDLTPGTKEFYETVARRFTEIIDHTQVVDGILQRSQIMRSSNSVTKMATSFMGEPTKQYNMLLSAVYDAAHAEKGTEARKTAQKRLARSTVTLLTAGVINAAMQSIVDAMRDDDREKDYWEKWMSAFTGFTGEEEGFRDSAKAVLGGNLGSTYNPASYLPFVKDLVSLLKGYDVTRMDMASADKTLTAASHFTKALDGTGKYTVAGASANLFAEAARMLGVPVANLKRDVLAAAKSLMRATGNHLAEYHLEKAALNMNYASSKKVFLDILYDAWQEDAEAYQIIYDDLVREDKLKTADKTTDKYIASGMENRMKTAQGVTEVKDLESRYLGPEQQRAYDAAKENLESSSLWNGATEDGRDAVTSILYGLLNGSNDTATKSAREKIEGGASVGLSQEEYLLYRLALSQVDEPTESGKYGSYTNEEVEMAIDMLKGLSGAERSYLWIAQGKNEKSNPWG